MDKNLKNGLIVVGVVAAILLLAFVAQAAGLRTASVPAGPQGGWAMNRMMWGGGMMGNMMGAASGGDFQSMAAFHMAHHGADGPNFEDCPHWQQSQ